MTMKMRLAFVPFCLAVLSINGPALAQAPISVDKAVQDAQVKNTLVAKLNLKRFEKTGQPVSCVRGKACFKVERFDCMANACSSGSKDPTRCISDEFKGDPAVGNTLLCEVIANPSGENRKAFLTAFPKFVKEPDLVQVVALVNAISGNAAVCQNIIKDYVGTDAKRWTQDWLVAMSACRILGYERTREQEENDYFVWHNVPARTTDCNDIKSIEMKNACFAGVQAP